MFCRVSRHKILTLVASHLSIRAIDQTRRFLKLPSSNSNSNTETSEELQGTTTSLAMLIRDKIPRRIRAVQGTLRTPDLPPLPATEALLCHTSRCLSRHTIL
jgi:hypothetical protein